MSGKNYFMIERKVRKRALLDLIEKNPELAEGKLKGIFSAQTGLTFNKIDQYLVELQEQGEIERGENGYWKHVKA